MVFFWFFTGGAHIVSSVLGQYQFSGFNTTKPTFITRRMRIQKKIWWEYHLKVWKAVCALKAFGCPKPCGCSVQPNLDWGDIYSFLFLILSSLRPKSSSVGIDDHTQSMENLWVPRGLLFSLKAELLPEFSPWRRGCPHVLLGQQGWSSRTFPHPGWRFFPAFFCHWNHLFCHGCLSDWALHILGVFKC